MRLCRKQLHDLDNPANARKNARGNGTVIEICRACDNDYQKETQGTAVCLPPDTKPIINGYKEPLRRVEGGFGYYGTIAYDSAEEYTQCHTCGYFYRHLGKHIRAAHGLSSDEYKLQYGLEKKTSSFATNTRTVHIQKWMDLPADLKAARLENLQAARTQHLEDTGNMAGVTNGGRRPKALEWFNKRGSCPDQIVDKILTLYEEGQEIPSSAKFVERWGAGYLKAARLHFGSYQEAMRQAGLNPLRRVGKARYTKEQLLESLREFKKTYGREPYYGEARTGVLIAMPATYQAHFGKWSKAKTEAFGGCSMTKDNGGNTI